jgi:hypothetical protein
VNHCAADACCHYTAQCRGKRQSTLKGSTDDCLHREKQKQVYQVFCVRFSQSVTNLGLSLAFFRVSCRNHARSTFLLASCVPHAWTFCKIERWCCPRIRLFLSSEKEKSSSRASRKTSVNSCVLRAVFSNHSVIPGRILPSWLLTDDSFPVACRILSSSISD